MHSERIRCALPLQSELSSCMLSPSPAASAPIALPGRPTSHCQLRSPPWRLPPPIFGSDSEKKGAKAGDAQTIDTAGLINRDLSQREFVATYGNRLDAVARDQKALKDAAVPRSEVEVLIATES